MKSEERRPSSMIEDARTGFNLLTWFLEGHVMAIAPFIRSGFGPRGIGVGGLIAAAMILMWGAYRNDDRMLAYLEVWFLTVIWRKIRADRCVHSEYHGWPWLTSLLLFGSKNEDRLRLVEPLVCLLAGSVLKAWSAAAGDFVMLGAASFALNAAIIVGMRRRHAESLRDAEIEAGYWDELARRR